MSQPRTQQLFAGDVTSAGITTLVTVAPAQRYLIKYANISSDSGAPGILGLLLYVASGVTPILVDLAPVQYRLVVEREIYAVLDEGDSIKALVGSVTGGDAHVHVGGLIFDL